MKQGSVPDMNVKSYKDALALISGTEDICPPEKIYIFTDNYLDNQRASTLFFSHKCDFPWFS